MLRRTLLRDNFLKVNRSGIFNKINKCNFTNSSLHGKKDFEEYKSKDASKKYMVEKDTDYRVTPKNYNLQFSKNPILDNFGDLPKGEIPEPLKYVRPFEMTVLENGVRVCTEHMDSPLCAVGVFVDAGSRYETLETSGSAHFLEHLLFKGTKNRTKSQFESEIEQMGATLDAYTSREHTLYHMQCFPKDVSKCVNILGDILQNPLLGKNQINEEKDTIKTELEESNKDVQEIIMEAAHFNSYRDHYMGQPILGDIDNIYNVNQDMVKEYHMTHYVGQNMIVVATGNVNHKEFVEQVSREFGSLNKNPPPGFQKKNTDKPIYTPSMMMMRDDENYNAGIGVFFDAPSWNHEDYYAFLLMERITGNYSADRNGYARLNDPIKQYSTLEANMADRPDISKACAIYTPYRDCGLFGTYFFGNEVWVRYMAYQGLSMPANYGLYMNQVEVFRGRARIWQELLNIQSPTDVLQLIGPQIL
jgi:processing peptidase subunit beta